MSKLHEIFDRAATHFESGVWMWNNGTFQETEGCRDLFLGICGAAAEIKHYGLAYDAIQAMVRHLGQPLGPWNTAKGRTMAEVIEDLRACAAKYEYRLQPA